MLVSHDCPLYPAEIYQHQHEITELFSTVPTKESPHAPMFTGIVDSMDRKAITQSRNKILRIFTILTQSETRDGSCIPRRRFPKLKRVGTGGEEQCDRWEFSIFL